MIGWLAFGAAYGLFVLSHAIPARPTVKQRIVARVGRPGYGIAYGLVSIATLAMLIVTANRAPFVPLLAPMPWMIAAPFVVMAPACLLVAFALLRPNPYSFGGWHDGAFDPANPGVVRFTRHPYLAALALWSFGHLLANPDLAHTILFGGFVVMALGGMAAINRRRRAGVTAPPTQTKREPSGMEGVEIALRTVGAAALYLVVVLLHPVLAGVDLRGHIAWLLH